MNGQEEAGHLGEKLNSLLEANPIDGNGEDWFSLTRTLKATLEMIEEQAKEDINKATRKAAGWSEEDLIRKMKQCFT